MLTLFLKKEKEKKVIFKFTNNKRLEHPLTAPPPRASTNAEPVFSSEGNGALEHTLFLKFG